MTLLTDTGPLVAFLSRRQAHHAWVRDVFARISPPLFTCEAVLTEVFFLVRGSRVATEAVQSLLQRNVLQVALSIAAEQDAIFKLMSRYAAVPMSFADACLVRMSELKKQSRILTLDSDFLIYRRNGREVIPTLMPR